MSKSKKRQGQSARQANMVVNPGRRMPNTRVRGSLSTNTIIKGNEAVVPLTTNGTAGIGTLIVPMIPGNINARVNSPISAVSALYSNGKYLPGTSFHYTPTVGTTTSGAVHICYIDNPELMLLAYIREAESRTAGNNNFANFVRSQSNSKTFAVWESFSVPINSLVRRKMFNVNTTIVLGESGNVLEFERSIQGMFLIAIEGGPPTNGVAVGRPWLNSTIALEGLRGAIDT